MPSVAIIIVVLSGLFHALRDFLTKRADNKTVFMWWYMLLGTFIPIPLYFYFLKDEVIGLAVIVIALVSGMIHVLYRVFLSKSLEYGDFSHVYPIARSAPALVLVFSIVFLKESTSLIGTLGILLVTFGVYTINLKKISLRTLIEPLKDILTCKASQYAFLTLLSVAIYSIVDKLGVDLIHPIGFFFLMEFFTIILFTGFLLLKGSLKKPLTEFKKHSLAIPLSAIFMVASYVMVLMAYRLTNVSYVVGLRQISVVFAVLLGFWFFKEKYKFIRFFSASVIFVGAFLISIA